MKIRNVILLIAGIAIALGSCKKEHELDGLTLFNPFEEGNGVELMEIDSVAKTYGTTNYLRAYFHVNEQYFLTTSQIKRIIVYRNDAELFRLAIGNDSTFVNFGLFVNGDYNYQIQALLEDSTYTKKSKKYNVIF